MIHSPSFLIRKKRDGFNLNSEEIADLMSGICQGEVADYQTTAFLMAVYFQGMSIDETAALTDSMRKNGEQYDLSGIPGSKVDKHSTGGIGDKVSLILGPLAQACGLCVPMLAGRSLGNTGGTIDKLESIPGYRVALETEEFSNILKDVGCVISGQTANLAPADKKLYALRDVTATVECIPLITASILSKKIASGTKTLLLDVKVGSGAFMKTQAESRKLAKSLIQVAERLGVHSRALLTQMNQPLGYAVGNSIEVMECLEILQNKKNPDFSSSDLTKLTLELCAHMLQMGGICTSLSEAKKIAQTRLEDGSAWKSFQKIVLAQGGKLEELKPLAPHRVIWKSEKSGYLNKMNAEVIGQILIELGGGRRQVGDPIDHQVGLAFHKKLGSEVGTEDPLVTVYAQEKNIKSLKKLEMQFLECLEIGSTRKRTAPLILEQLG